ncbi:MAG: hypothetical protein ACLUR9_10060 [Christensenellales bacterium]
MNVIKARLAREMFFYSIEVKYMEKIFTKFFEMKKVGFFMRKREYKKTERRLLENWANGGAKLIKYIIFSGKYGRMEEKRVECFRK